MGYEHPSCQPVGSTVVDLHAYKTNCRTRQSRTRGFACDLTSKDQIWSHLGWAKGLLLFYLTWYSVGKGVTPKATSRGEQPISRTLGLEGPRVCLSDFIQTSASGWRCSILETPPLEILLSFQQPEKRLRINKKEVGCPSAGCRRAHLLAKGYWGATDSPGYSRTA